MNSIGTDFDYVIIRKKVHPSVIPPCNRATYLLHSHIVRGFVVWLTVIILFNTQAFPTTFVYLVTSHGLYIGADSMRTWYGLKNPESICKIKVVRGTVMLTWGNAGFSAIDQRTGNPLIKPMVYSSIAEPVLNMNVDAKTKSEILEKRTEAYIRSMISATDKLKLPVTEMDIQRKLVGEAFMAYESGVPAVYWFEVRVNDWKKRELYITPARLSPSALNKDRRGIPQVLGNDEGWVAYLTNNPPFVHDATEEEAIRTIKAILDLQAMYTPNDVGPPFAIAVLEPGGLRWIQGGICKAATPKQEQHKIEKTK